MDFCNKQRVNQAFVWLTGILYATNFWYRASFAPITDVLQSEFNATSAEIGRMYALFWFGYVIFQIPSGLLLQYVSAEFVAVICGFLCAIAALFFALPIGGDSIVFPTAIMVLSGIASSPILLVKFKLIAQNMGTNSVPFIGGIILFMSAATQASGNFVQAYLWQQHGIWREMYLGCSAVIFFIFVVLSIEFLIIKYQRDDSSKQDTSIQDGNRPSAGDHTNYIESTSPTAISMEVTQNKETTNISSTVISSSKERARADTKNVPKSPMESLKLAFSNPWNYIIGLHVFTVVIISINFTDSPFEHSDAIFHVF